MNLEEERTQWELEASKQPLPKDTSCFEDNLSGISCLWVSRENVVENKVVLYLHGGGLISGSAKTHLCFAANLSRSLRMSVLLVNYRLLPEHDYPAPLDDTLLVYNALINDRNYAPEQIVLGGDSSGGGLVLAALVQLKNAGALLPYCAFAISGTFDMTLSGASMRDNAYTDPMLSFEELKEWQEKYLHFDLTSPLLSPLFSDLSNLPPILLLAGGKEPWLSDSLRVAEKITVTNGNVELRVWESMGHVWVMDSEKKESGEALLAIKHFVR